MHVGGFIFVQISKKPVKSPTNCPKIENDVW